MVSDKSSVTRKTPGSNGSRSARHRAREFAVQGVYQWLLAATPVETIEKELADSEDFSKIDRNYFSLLLRGAITSQSDLETALKPYLDRNMEELSPIERGILILAGFELKHQIEVPYRVVINEAVELAKTFGGADGHKYVNGVLDKLAADFRAIEMHGR